MKKIIALLILVLLTTGANAQFKKPEDGSRINRSTNNLILGIFNPKNFSMTHSFQVSMMSSAYGSMSVTSYINTMNYKVTDKLNVSADVSLRYAPYVSSSFGQSYANALQKDINGLSLSRLSVDYKISDNSFIKLEYRKFDGLDYFGNNRYSPYDYFYR